MKRYMALFFVSGLLLAGCGKLDDYQVPSKTIEGTVVDAETGENIQTRQPDGIKIRLLEQQYEKPVPNDFWCKADGTFKNVKLFPGQYKVIPVDGPFEQASVDTLLVDLSQNQQVSFKVDPFVRITSPVITREGSGIKATYKISQGGSEKKILKSMLICYTSPILHEATTGKLSSPENNLAGRTTDEIESLTFEDVIDNVPAGKIIYARIAVQTENPLNRFNYSPIIEIQF